MELLILFLATCCGIAAFGMCMAFDGDSVELENRAQADRIKREQEFCDRANGRLPPEGPR